MDKIVLLGKTMPELKLLSEELGLPKFAARQIADWLYKKNVDSVEQMTNISLANRNKISERCVVGKSLPENVMVSADGTKKYLFRVQDKFVEAVYIPEKDRATLCVSSQVGCKMNCLFCMTGKQGFGCSLTSGEILNQMQAIPEFDKLTNVVFMGMGEPMDNVKNVLAALEIMTSDYGYAWSPKRVTVSTVGIVPGMREFLQKSSCHLAVSLHNPFPDERLVMMPIEKAYSIVDVLSEIRKYDFTGQRRVSFEYTMFKGKNDTPRHAAELKRLLDGLECRMNLIRFHSIPDVPLEGSSDDEIEKFQSELSKRGVLATIRKSRGEDIFAACGLLSTMKKNNEL